MYEDILEKVLFSKEQLAKRIKELAEQLDKDYAGKTPLMVAILKGSVMFFTDLIREMTLPLEIDFMSISSYGSGVKSSGEVKMIKDLDNKIEGKDVIIVEDIVDSGYTMKYLTHLLEARNPSSIKICALLDKPSRRETDVAVDYKGFEVGNEFVVGYGLDYAARYRNIPFIGILKRSVYEK
ncbi:MAG: hypoxanthine phosphoribosyltransferase [Candidatus Borkfalkiaceae bacterium]|nr:hypoxanthine phosphoribosyltransferase [Eubacteriales bacterium]MDY5819954.1 hypoxanthine phosphoribosyltransferase [Christensenellaceae bacterium]